MNTDEVTPGTPLTEPALLYLELGLGLGVSPLHPCPAPPPDDSRAPSEGDHDEQQ